MKTKHQESLCRSLLFLLLSLSLAVAVLQAFRPRPCQLYGSVGLIWETALIPIGGPLFPLTQIGSAVSGFLAWITDRILGLPYQLGLLLPPVLAFAGALLLYFRVERGKALLLAAEIPSAMTAAIPALFSLFTLPFAKDFSISLQQTLYYLLMLAIPIVKCILLHNWLECRPNQ